MTTINIRRQGGAAIMTIPSDLMKRLGAGIGTSLDVSVVDGVLEARPLRSSPRRRYTLDELLVGASPETMRAIADDTEWARDGDAVGREL